MIARGPLLRALLVAGLAIPACVGVQPCPAATLSAINARYVARGLELCSGTPLKRCAARQQLIDERYALEENAGCH